MEQSTIGDNVARLRRATPMTQEALAEAAGLSVETIRKLEQNKSTSARMSTLHKLACALHVPTSRLLGNAARAAAHGSSDVDGLGLIELRKALTPARGLRGTPLAGRELEPPTLDDVRTSVRSLDRAYHLDDYATTLAGLPLLIAEARTAVAESARDDRADALDLMAQTCQLAGTALIQLRAFDLAHRPPRYETTATTTRTRCSTALRLRPPGSVTGSRSRGCRRGRPRSGTSTARPSSGNGSSPS